MKYVSEEIELQGRDVEARIKEFVRYAYIEYVKETNGHHVDAETFVGEYLSNGLRRRLMAYVVINAERYAAEGNRLQYIADELERLAGVLGGVQQAIPWGPSDLGPPPSPSPAA